MPGTSKCGRRSLRDSGTNAAAAASATSTTGMLMRKTEPHQKVVSSQPPSRGPMGWPIMVAAMTAATALGRSSSEKSEGSAPRAAGMTMAAPTPSRMRAAMNCPDVPAYAHASEPTPRTTRAMSSSRLRPYLSASSPAGTITAAKTSMYAETNHCSCEVDA